MWIPSVVAVIMCGCAAASVRDVVLRVEEADRCEHCDPSSSSELQVEDYLVSFPDGTGSGETESLSQLETNQQSPRFFPHLAIAASRLPFPQVAFSTFRRGPPYGRPDFPDRYGVQAYSRPRPQAYHEYPVYIQRNPQPQPQPQPLPLPTPPADLFICPDRHSCSDSVWVRADSRESLSWRDRGCFCDADCHRYGDCCRDAEASPQLQETEPVTPPLTCQPVLPLTSFQMADSAPPVTVYMQNKCASNFDLYHNKMSCERAERTDADPLASLPVTSGVTNITYKNLFCAMCNNDTERLHFWQVGVQCPEVRPGEALGTASDVMEVLSRTRSGGWGIQLPSGRLAQCSITPRPPAQVRSRRCLSLESRCSLASPGHLIELCRNHTAVVFSDGRAYRNVYCLICSWGGGQLPSVECSAPCGPAEEPAGSGGLRTRLQLVPGGDRRCGDRQIWDPFTRSCRSLDCSRPGYYKPEGAEECEPVSNQITEGEEESLMVQSGVGEETEAPPQELLEMEEGETLEEVDVIFDVELEDGENMQIRQQEMTASTEEEPNTGDLRRDVVSMPAEGRFADDLVSPDVSQEVAEGGKILVPSTRDIDQTIDGQREEEEKKKKAMLHILLSDAIPIHRMERPREGEEKLRRTEDEKARQKGEEKSENHEDKQKVKVGELDLTLSTGFVPPGVSTVLKKHVQEAAETNMSSASRQADTAQPPKRGTDADAGGNVEGSGAADEDLLLLQEDLNLEENDII